jgi:hypothetical protein
MESNHTSWNLPRKVAGSNSIRLFPELTLKELVFLHHEYYSIFLLQQEASAL